VFSERTSVGLDVHARSATARGHHALGVLLIGGTSPLPGENPVIANVALARELAGWCWSLATLTD